MTEPLQPASSTPRVPVKWEQAGAALAMALICLITFANVLTRYLSNYSFAFTEEFSIFLMVIMTFLGASAAFGLDRHIRMNFLTERLTPLWARRVELLVTVLAIALFGMLVGYGFRLTWDDWRFDTTSPGMGLPQWIYSVWLPLLSLLIELRLLGHMARVWRRGQ
jgi:TRAP-type C4-dicarboxylate transport system permease small subunit